jgi:hypothetical protein
MTSGPRLEMVGSQRSVGGFHGVRVSSRVFLVLRWMTLEKVLGVRIERRWLYLAARVLGVGPTRRCLILSS